jgi:hypothetical protein
MISVLLVLTVVSLAGRPPVPFSTVAEGHQSGVEQQREVVIRTATEWKALWKEHAPAEPLPAVDFAKSTVVGVFLGSRNTGGYRATITAIDHADHDGADLVVTWREDRPGRRDLVSQMLTSPFHLVRIERIAESVKFRRAGG